jgi:hypothetical protein
MGIKDSNSSSCFCNKCCVIEFLEIKVIKMKENTKQKLFAIAVLVTLVGGSWLIVKYGKYKVDETMYIHYHH